MIANLIGAVVMMALALFAFGGLRAARGWDWLLAAVACLFLALETIGSAMRATSAADLVGSYNLSAPATALALITAFRAPSWASGLPERIVHFLHPLIRPGGL